MYDYLYMSLYTVCIFISSIFLYIFFCYLYVWLFKCIAQSLDLYTCNITSTSLNIFILISCHIICVFHICLKCVDESLVLYAYIFISGYLLVSFFWGGRRGSESLSFALPQIHLCLSLNIPPNHLCLFLHASLFVHLWLFVNVNYYCMYLYFFTCISFSMSLISACIFIALPVYISLHEYPSICHF